MDAENLHAQCGRFMPRWLHHRIPRGLLACATAPSLKPTPTTTWAASPQHQLKVSPVPPYNTSCRPYIPCRRLEKIPRTHIRHSPQRRGALPDHSTNGPRHRPITVRPTTGRPDERLSRSPASKQLRNRCAASPATETATRAWLCSVLRSALSDTLHTPFHALWPTRSQRLNARTTQPLTLLSNRPARPWRGSHDERHRY